jgi:8-oxo-dGTP pyrophosphatase MutT (NUDIX family)
MRRVLDALERQGYLGEPKPPDEATVAWITVFETNPPPTLGAAAVLVALFEEQGEVRVLLTRRSSALRLHRGEVSFPGGRIDVGEGLADAALREAHEEVGLAPNSVHVVGALHPVMTFVSGTHITPVLGVLDRRPALSANPSEVERCFDVSLAELAVPEVFHEEQWSIDGRKVRGAAHGYFPVWFFEVAGEIVWGATARMLYELLTVVVGMGPEQTR